MIESRCRVLSDGKGGYFNCKQDIDGLTQENYQIYKDYQFMNMIKEKYSSYWNMLLFAEKWNDQFVISCFDLKHDLIAVSYTHLDVYKRQNQPNAQNQIDLVERISNA